MALFLERKNRLLPSHPSESTSATSPNFASLPASGAVNPNNPELLGRSCPQFDIAVAPIYSHCPRYCGHRTSARLFVTVNEPTGFPWLHSSTWPYFASGLL